VAADDSADPEPDTAGAAEPGAARQETGTAGTVEPGAEPLGVVIAVDGPAGSGKSSAARGVAATLGLRYLDTGAMYRAVTWWLLENGIDPANVDRVAEQLPGIVLSISTDTAAQVVRVGGVEVTGQIRSRRVSNAVSSVAAIPRVRSHLIAMQRSLIGAAVASGAGIVAEGRDIGTVVAPDAEVKIFLTASERARAERRAAELARAASAGGSASQLAQGAAAQQETGSCPAADQAVQDHPPTADLTLSEQARRDRYDAPQTQRAADAIEIDATELELDEVIARIVRLADSRAGAPWTS